VYLVLAAAASVAGAGIIGVAGAKVVADLLVMAGIVLWVQRSYVCDVEHAPAGEAAAIAGACAPICATQLMRGLAIGSDIIILGMMMSRADVGIYAVASRLFMFMMSLAGSYFVIQLPRFAEHAAESTTVLRRELSTSLRRTLPLGGLGIVALAVLAGPVLWLLFGDGFGEAAMSLRLLGIAVVANLVGRTYRQILLVREKQGVDFRVSVAGTAVHIAVKLALIPMFGILGAAIGTLAGETFQMLAQMRAAGEELRRVTITPADEPTKA